MWRGEGVSDLVILQCESTSADSFICFSQQQEPVKGGFYRAFRDFSHPVEKNGKSASQSNTVRIHWRYLLGTLWLLVEFGQSTFPIWARENVSLLISIRPSPREPGMGTWPGHSLHAFFLLPGLLMSLSPEKPHTTDGGKTLNHFLFQKIQDFCCHDALCARRFAVTLLALKQSTLCFQNALSWDINLKSRIIFKMEINF